MEIKYRQRIIVGKDTKAFWYWGFKDGKFIPPYPVHGDREVSDAEENSEQFTGHHDKHKKPIYVGDRLLINDGDDVQISTVVFRNGAFEVEGVFNCGSVDGSDSCDLMPIGYFEETPYELEVIGNTWQDPEEATNEKS